MPHRLFTALALSFAALLAFGCGSGDAPVGETVEAPILNSRLQDLTIVVGTTVVWDNVSGPQHTVTSGTPADTTGVFASEFLSRGDTYSFTFTKPGTHVYYCRFHPVAMTGTITVTDG